MIADQLRYFLAAARHEHLGRAAEELGMSQPALSRSILRLEDELGVQLFDRAGRGVRLNASGRLLLRRVERAFAELEDARREITELADRAGRTVSIGFLATLGERLIPELIRGFRASAPGVEFRLLQGPHPMLRQKLAEGEIDLCLVSPRIVDAGIEWRPLYEEELRVLVPAGHRLAGRGEIGLSEIAGEPIIALKSTYGLRQSLDRLAGEAGFTPIIAFEAEEIATLQGLVGASFGVTLVPESAVRTDDLSVSLHVTAPACGRTVGLAWRSGRFLPARAIAFRDYVLERYRT